MSVFQFTPKQLCRHGKRVRGCSVASCEHYSGYDENDPRRYFGKDSSAEASRLMRENPAKYAEMRKRAVAMKLLLV